MEVVPALFDAVYAPPRVLMLERLRSTTFRISDELIDQAIARDAARRGQR